MIKKLQVSFYSMVSKLTSKGEAPIYCRIAIAEDKKQFSTGLYITPKDWDKIRQKAKGCKYFKVQEAVTYNKSQQVYAC